jgi:anti-anti-sigma factor
VSSFAIATTTHGPSCDVTVSGEIDISAVADLTTAASRSLSETDVQRIVMNLAEVTFIDCAGLGALVTVRNNSVAAGKEVALCNVPKRVRRMLALTELATAFTLVGTTLKKRSPTPRRLDSSQAHRSPASLPSLPRPATRTHPTPTATTPR